MSFKMQACEGPEGARPLRIVGEDCVQMALGTLGGTMGRGKTPSGARPGMALGSDRGLHAALAALGSLQWKHGPCCRSHVGYS